MFRIAFFLILLPLSVFAQSPEVLFDKAQLVLSTGREREALDLFDRIRREGGGSAKLDYNIGVLALRTGSRGIAIWNLRRAVRHYPLDQRFLDKLQEARGEATLRAPISLSVSIEMLRFLMIVSLCLTLFLRYRLVRFLGLAGIVFSVVALSFGELATNRLGLNKGVFIVTAERAEVYSAPSKEVQVVELAVNGSELAIADEQGEWILVTLRSGRTGWIDLKNGAIEEG